MKVVKWLDENFEYVCLAILLMVMTVLGSLNVILRYCFKNPIAWSDEVCCYSLALSAFFCLPCSIKNQSEIRVDALITILPSKLVGILKRVCQIIMLIFLGICTVGGFSITQNAVNVSQKSSALQIPVSVLYGITTFCFILSIFRLVQSVITDFQRKEGKDK